MFFVKVLVLRAVRRNPQRSTLLRKPKNRKLKRSVPNMNPEIRKNVSETLKEKLKLLNLKSSESVLRRRSSLKRRSNNSNSANNKFSNST
jgi:hypothetical protein